ncbi:MAG: hypothetical protein ACM3TN_14030 [Alphaproteobacteria bacterium]
MKQDAPKSDSPGAIKPGKIAKIPEPSSPQAPPPPVNPGIQRVFPESALAAPDKDSASRHIAYDTSLSTRAPGSKNLAGWQYRRNRQGKIVGFEFSNTGGNPVLPPRRDALRNQFFTRDFQFRFDERARQDIHLLISDWVPSRDRQFRLSELMNSLIHFFPRAMLPAIVNVGDRDIVTLPTGEEVMFDAATHEIRGGVLVEAPVDLNPDRGARRFAAIEYKGKGVIVRANSRGTDPRIGTTAIISNGAPRPECAPGADCAQCRVPAREIWEQSGAVRFKFSSDKDFDRFLLYRCGFGLQMTGVESALVSPAK